MVGHRQLCSEATYNLNIQSVDQVLIRYSAVSPSVEGTSDEMRLKLWSCKCACFGPVADLGYGAVDLPCFSL